MITALLALLHAAQADDTFYVDAGPTLASYEAERAGGVVLGRTGALLVKSAEADALRAWPGVGQVEARPGGLLRVWPAPGTDDLALARDLHGQPGIAWVNPDLILRARPQAVPTDPFYADEWHLDNTGQGGRTPNVDINAPRAWERSAGEGVLIAVLDTGVELSHPDLRVTAGHDYLDGDEDPSPTSDDPNANPHGTCASGVAAAIGDNDRGPAGVAYDADIYAIRLIGGGSSLSDLHSAFVEAVDAGASVLNNSWGWGDDCPAVRNYSTFQDMFSYAEEVGRGGLGALVVFSAGNGACDIVDDGMLSNESLLVVSAIESDDRRAWYSSYGAAVDLTAPTTLLTTDLSTGGYGSYGGDDATVDAFNGTSASAPVVSGVAALLVAANPRATAAQLRAALCATAVRNDIAHAGYDEDGRSPYYGCGRVDAGAAVDAVYNRSPEAPVPTLTAETVEEGRAILAWEPAVDADDDVIAYELTWSANAGTSGEQSTSGLWVDIGADLVPGDVVTWSVHAVDPWGPGPDCPPQTFTVRVDTPADTGAPAAADSATPTPEAAAPSPSPAENSGCQHVSGGGLWALALLGLRQRRRRA